MSKFDIQHDVKHAKFYSVVGGKECSLKYERISNDVLDYKVLYVPKNIRDQGIASRIVEYALLYAKEKSIKIKPTCSYVDSYLKSHKEFQEILVNEAT